jgi:hypothetical protein
MYTNPLQKKRNQHSSTTLLYKWHTIVKNFKKKIGDESGVVKVGEEYNGRRGK